VQLVENLGLQAVWDAVEPYLAAERIELDDLELVGRGSTRTLRVTVDGANVDLDRIAEVSKGLSRLLDHTEGAPDGSYQLEVTSPGLERRLTRPRHFQKSLGREAVVKTAAGSKRGLIVSADDAQFVLETEGVPEPIRYDEVKAARTVFTWERPPKPGATKKIGNEEQR
jgi:ribosome maturation factor RimP